MAKAVNSDILQMNPISLLLLFLALSGSASAQLLLPADSFSAEGQMIAADKLGNVWVAGGNRLLKFSPGQKTPLPYQEYRFGKIGMIDVSNPLKPLVYFPDFMTVVVLDKFLSPLVSYSFFELGYQNVTAVCNSTDGRFWFYDNIRFMLKKMDEAGKILRESPPLNQILKTSVQPTFIQEKDNQVLVNDPEQGILVFDVFAGYAKTLPVKNIRRFQLHGGKIYYCLQGMLCSWDPLTMEQKCIELPEPGNILDAAVTQDRLFLLRKGMVESYQFK